MPQLPINRIPASAGNPGGQGLNVRASAGMFDTSDPNAGRGLALLSQQSGAFSRAQYREYAQGQADRRDTELANHIAMFDPTPGMLAAREASTADGSDLYETTRTYLQNSIEETAAGIDDDVVRMEFRNRMLGRMPDWMSSTAAFAAAQRSDYYEGQSNAALGALINRVRADPLVYDQVLADGFSIIDTQEGLSNSMRTSMRIAWRQDTARRMFEGRLERAATAADIDAIANDLVNEEGPVNWAEEMAPADFDRTLSALSAARSSLAGAAQAQARSVLSDLEARTDDLSLVSPTELQEAQTLARASGDAALIDRYARVARSQDILRTERGLPPAEINARANEQTNAGAAYPGLPAEVSSAVNEAVSLVPGVSAAFLGGLVTREYGGYLTGEAAPTNPDFAPAPVHQGVDLRNIRPDVVRAATLAGEAFGAPLQVTSGYRSQERQDAIVAANAERNDGVHDSQVADYSHHTSGTAIDIVTVGMSDEEKGRLIGALADAGFTGFGEYGTHVHADFRVAVPDTFNPTTGWGGWTNLSPSVLAALQERGFAAGTPADQITRGGVVGLGAASVPVDYGRGTQLTTPDGQPASSAVGIAQFTDATWLGLMHDGTTAARFGVDVAGRSDEDLLAMRADPSLSVLFTAALAEQRRTQVEAAIGRPITDAELYMAHALGAGGAITLLSALRRQPDVPADILLSSAARANRPLFYDDDGVPFTVREVYEQYAVGFGTDPSRIAYGDAEVRRDLAENVERQLADDPIAFARQTGQFAIIPLSEPGGIAARGEAVRAIADYYGIPLSEMKAFEDSELQYLVQRIDDATPDQVMSLMTEIQGMGAEVADAAYAQLEQESPVYAYAAQLGFNRGVTAVGRDIIRGQKRIEDNPDLVTRIGATADDRAAAFFAYAGNALYDLEPKDQQAIMDAAWAYYVETYGSTGSWDNDAYQTSVERVLGGTDGSAAIDSVNGGAALMPPGFDGDGLEALFSRMTTNDWAAMSETNTAPLYADGSPVDADTLANGIQLRALGGNQYRLVTDDGRFIMTRTGQITRAYVLNFDPARAAAIMSRPDANLDWVNPGMAAAARTGAQTPEPDYWYLEDNPTPPEELPPLLVPPGR